MDKPVHPVELDTERLLLRPIRVSDLDDLFAYHGLEEVARYQYWTARSREELAEKVVEWARLDGTARPLEQVVLGCELKVENRVIGDVFVGVRDRAARQGEIGYSFNPEFQRQGFGTEAVRALLDYAFGTLGMHRVYGRCDARNSASWRLLERLGLRREAHFREHAIFKGKWDEEFCYAMLESEWANEDHRGRA